MNPTRILVPLLAAIALAVPATSATASAAPAVAPVASSHAGTTPTVLIWNKREAEVTLPVDATMIPGAPASFRQFARAQLRQTWKGFLHGKPACKKAPDFDVRRLSTSGYAYGDAGTYPQPGCQTGGGYVAFWAIRHGEWKQVIGTQDVASCQRLAKLGFPSSVADTTCYDGTEVIPYSHP